MEPSYRLVIDDKGYTITTDGIITIKQSKVDGNTTIRIEPHDEIETHPVTIPSAQLFQVTEVEQPVTTEVKEEEIADFETILERTKTNILSLDKHLEEGGRVNVGDKYLLNCQADLNQLVPFKYNWSWSLYLTSCDNHWMPAEVDLSKDALDWKTLPTSIKSIVLRAWYNHEYQQLLFPVSSVLNCYRIITNPECRQYILRQSFEIVLTKQSWIYITESLVEEQTLAVHKVDKNGTPLRMSLNNLDQTFRDRFSLAKFWLDGIHNLNFTTETKEKTGQFVSECLIAFGYLNFLMHLPTYFQILNLSRNNGKMKGLASIISKQLRDGLTQFEFLKLFLNSLLNENTGCLDSTTLSNIQKDFKKFYDIEIDLISLSASDEKEYAQVKYILSVFITDLLAVVGIDDHPTYIKTIKSTSTSDLEWFFNLVTELTPKIDFQSTLTGGALEF